jgi:hypothetical protein
MGFAFIRKKGGKMKARHLEVEVDVWKISTDEPTEEWVRDAFRKDWLRWNGHFASLSWWRILIGIPEPAVYEMDDEPLLIVVGFRLPEFGKIGEYLVDNRGTLEVFSEKKAKKELRFLES